MGSIDNYIGVPLLISAGLGVLLFLFLLIMKLRNTTKVSFTFFIVTGILVACSVFTYFDLHFIYFVFAVILAEFIALPYLIIKAFDNPEKREKKKEEKRLAEQNAAIENSDVVKKVIADLETKNQKLLEVNKTLVSQVSTFFSRDKSMENFLDYCNKMITEKVNADGCVILIGDDYDNTLAVKSLMGSFPPPYKLPDDLPHKPLRVETNLRFAQFPLAGNIFG
ncbi:MAG: hypothetical protein K5907_07550, partial [Treponema sp.]|nr:hypothetical protein [Treponema sp.]